MNPKAVKSDCNCKACKYYRDLKKCPRCGHVFNTK